MHGYSIDESFKYICPVFGNRCDGNIRLLFPYLILNQGRSHWLWIPTALALGAFVWLLTLHPAASGTYLCRLWRNLYFYRIAMVALCRSSLFIRWDIMGGTVVLIGAAMIIFTTTKGLVR